MTVQCIACRHFSYQDAPRSIVADGSFGHCAFDPKYRFSSAIFEHHCSQFKEADAEAVAKRRVWRDGKRAEFLRGIGA